MAWGVAEVTVAFGHTRALDEVTLSLAPGSTTAIVGGDGAGKTTILKVLAGAAAPTSGTVRRPDRRRTGYMSAGSGVYPDLSVSENLSFVASAYGIREDVRRERTSRLLGQTGLADAQDRLAGQLSGGMRQKLALTMAMLHEPELLVLDEPTTGLDPVSRAELWRMIGKTVASGTTVAFSSAYLDEAERAGWVLVLEAGRAIAAGSPDDVIAAIPGAIVESATSPAGVHSWRRGSRWRSWSPDGTIPGGGTLAAPDLEDAAIVATLVDRSRRDRSGVPT
jgi:ABC-2 type transport system ATP-binding protein